MSKIVDLSDVYDDIDWNDPSLVGRQVRIREDQYIGPETAINEVAKDDIVVKSDASNEQVRQAMIFQKPQLALAENGIMPDGEYTMQIICHPTQPEVPIYVAKIIKDGPRFQLAQNVSDYAKKDFMEQLKMAKDKYQSDMDNINQMRAAQIAKGERPDKAADMYFGIKYMEPVWVRNHILFEVPDMPNDEYERKILSEYPDFWVAEHLRPKRRIKI